MRLNHKLAPSHPGGQRRGMIRALFRAAFLVATERPDRPLVRAAFRADADR
jgi:hypothetical protein